jgi:hypothetical protein
MVTCRRSGDGSSTWRCQEVAAEWRGPRTQRPVSLHVAPKDRIDRGLVLGPTSPGKVKWARRRGNRRPRDRSEADPAAVELLREVVPEEAFDDIAVMSSR